MAREYSVRRVRNNPHSPGPRLVDYALYLIRENGLKAKDVKERFGVSIAWLSDQELGKSTTSDADTIQTIIEAISGKPLVSTHRGCPPPPQQESTQA